MRSRSLLSRAGRFIVYVVAWHLVRVLCELLLPNAHLFNLVRGWCFGMFFKAHGRRLAIASGCTINAPWNLEVGSNVYLAHRVWINASGELNIGDGVIISPNVVIATTAHDRQDGRVSLHRSRLAPVSIGAGAWIASNSVVTRGSRIGAGAVIGAGSVVIGEVPSACFFAGNPATLIRSL